MERTAGKSLRTRRAMEQAIHLIFLLCGIVAVGFVLCISVYLVISGLPAIREIGLTKFLFGKVWAPTNATTGPQFGILPFILTSVYGTAGALLLGVPVGLMTAIFLAKAAPPRLAAVIRTAVQLLAGIPSVVYGLVGMIVLVPAIRRAFGLGSGACLLAAILVLTVMVLPSIINVAETALQAVPREYEEASLALGATETETYFRVSLPAARSGVAAAVVLGVGRAIGEAMAIIMVAGNVANMPGLFTSVRFLTTGIISGMSDAAVGSLYQQALFSIGIMFMQSLVNSYGSSFMAGFNGANKIDTFAFLPVQSLSNALTTYTGQNIGAGNQHRVKEGLKASLIMSIGCCIVVGILLYPTSAFMMRMFSQNAEVIDAGVAYLHGVLPFYFLLAITFMYNSVLRGAGDMVIPMISSFVSLWLARLPAAYLIAHLFEKEDIYYSYAVGWALGVLISGIYYMTGKWKNKSVVERMKKQEA